jgi:hypothetical protein
VKKRFFSLSTVLAVVMAVGVSCKDSFLESVPQNGTFTDLSVFQNKADFDSYLFGAYTEFQGSFDGSGAAAWVLVPGKIMQDIKLGDERPVVLTSFLTPGTSDFGIWTPLYKSIGRVNLILDKVPNAPATIAQADKDRIAAEAKFLRGFAYFMLARAYGNIPMPLKSYDASQNSMECTPEASVWDQVIKDLTEASQGLPRRAEWGDANLGRATKGSALAYLANAQMYKKAWDPAAKASQDLIALGDYQLLPDVRQVFSPKSDNSQESIFEVQYRDVDNGNVVWSGQPNNGNVLPEWTSPRNLGDAYAPFGGWGEGVMNKKLADSFEKGDQRRGKLVVAVGETYQGEGMKTPVTIPATITQNKSAFSTKYWLGPGDKYLSGQNIPAMRYAEFLLNYAEILFEQGKTAEAYQQLNAVRKRAGLPDKPVSGDRETFFTALMNERRWELNFEPNVWWHYTRTGRAGKFLQDEYGLTFNPAWNKLPIPQADRDQNPKLCQNPGY